MKKTFYLLLMSITILCAGCQSEQKNIDLEAIHQQNLKDSTLATGWYYVSNDSTGFVRKVSRAIDIFYINPKPIVVASHIDKIKLIGNDNVQSILMRLDEVGAELWREATKKAIGNYLLFVVDNELIACPLVNSEISGGATIFHRDDYSKEEYKIIEEKINKDRNI